MIAKRALIIVVSLLILLSFAFPSTASAYDPFKDPCSGSGADSSICKTEDKDPVTGKDGIIYKVSILISFIAGAVAVIMIIYASFLFVTSNGNTEKATKARRTIVYVCIGLIVIVFAAQLVALVASKVT